jgi:NhaP-type Na+/H+ or K+/H+ antiporter
MGLAGTTLKRLPLSAAMVYIAFGYVLGPVALGMVQLNIPGDVHVLRVIAEVGLLISLFSVGLRLRIAPTNALWRLPLRLGLLAMVITITGLTGVGALLLHLELGAAVVLAAALAPTDPVLAHDVRVREPGDADAVRFTLSGEGGLNDGAAYPFALLGIVLCVSSPAGAYPWLAFAASVLWGISAGAASGWLLGYGTARFVAYMRTRYHESLGLEGFFTLGLIALSYGVALLLGAYAFLAVFAAGVALRHVEHRTSGGQSAKEVLGAVEGDEIPEAATDPARAQAFMTETIMGFTVELERIAEVTLMVLSGCLISQYWREMLAWQSAVSVVFLLFIIRPLSVWLSLAGAAVKRRERRLIGWLGLRGAGSLFYVMFALERAPKAGLERLIPLVLSVIAASVVLHGLSATPLMQRHGRQVYEDNG